MSTNLSPQKGGEKLGQGGFGCVVRPAIACRRKQQPPPNSVSKITYVIPGYESDYEDELRMLKKIRTIDPDQKYFISVFDECELDTNASSKRNPKDLVEVSFEDEDLEEFSVRRSEPKYISRMKKQDIQKQYCLVDSDLEPRNQIQVFGGYGLDELNPDTHPKIYNAIRKKYKSVVRHLIHGLHVMHRNRIAHRDIKEFNMLGMLAPISHGSQHQLKKINKHTTKNQHDKTDKSKIHTQRQTKRQIPANPLVRYIDFGLSEFINPGQDEGGVRNFHWSGTDGYIPIEYLILYYMRDYINIYGISTTIQPSNKQKIIDKVHDRYQRKYKSFYDDIHIEQSLMSPTRTTHSFFNTDEISKIFDRLVKSLSDGTFYKLQKTDYTGLVYKSDVFALGITLAFIRRHYRLQHDMKLTDLITKMIKISAEDRPTTLECLKHPFFS
jgi:serine/threonine protein kinase